MSSAPKCSDHCKINPSRCLAITAHRCKINSLTQTLQPASAHAAQKRLQSPFRVQTPWKLHRHIQNLPMHARGVHRTSHRHARSASILHHLTLIMHTKQRSMGSTRSTCLILARYRLSLALALVLPHAVSMEPHNLITHRQTSHPRDKHPAHNVPPVPQVLVLWL